MTTDSLNRIAEKIAQRLEEEKGIPYQVSYDRIVGAPGWREREIDYLAKQVEISQEELDKIQKDATLAETRATLITRQREQEKIPVEVPPEKPDTSDLSPKAAALVEKIWERRAKPTVAVGIKTENPQEIKNTKDVQDLRKDNPNLYSLLVNSGIDAFQKEVEKIRKEEKAAARAESAVRVLEANRQRRQQAVDEKLQEEYASSLKEYESNIRQLKKTHVKVGDNEWIDKNTYNNLTADEKKVVEARGVEGLTEYNRKELLRKHEKSIKLPPEARQIYDASSPEDKFSILKSYGLVPRMAEYTGSANGVPLYKVKGFAWNEFVTSEEASNILETTAPIPFVYTLAHGDEMSSLERNLWLGLDVAMILIPVTAAGVRETAVGARASQSALAVTKAQRIKGAVGGVRTGEGIIGGLLPGVKNEFIAQVKAPIVATLHPVATTKAALKDATYKLESLLRTDKIAFAAVSDTYGTVRVPKLSGLDEKDIMLVRDRLVREAAQTGANIAIEYKGYRFILRRSLLTKATGGGLAHATPAGEAFIEGTKIKVKPGMPLSEQGLFLSPEPLPRFTEKAAFGGSGEMNSLLIFSPGDARAAVSSEKIYRPGGQPTAELEAKFKVNATTNKPKQILFFRQGPEQTKVFVQLQEPLSRLEIAKLKNKALIREFTTVFNPVLEIKDISGKGSGVKIVDSLTDADTDELLRILRRTGNREVAENITIARAGFRNIARTGAAARRTSTIARAEVNIAGRDPVRINIDAERITRANTGPVKRISLKQIRRDAKREKTDAELERLKPTKRKPSERELLERGPAKRIPGKRAPAEREPTERVVSEREPIERAPAGKEPPERVPPKREPPPKMPKEEINKGKFIFDLGDDKESRRKVKESGGAITWRMGQVGKKDRWDVIVHPYTADEHGMIILGPPPEGATIVSRGKGSAKATAQMIRGKKKPSRTVDVDSGITDIKVSPGTGRRINLNFTADPKLETKGDITLGRKGGSITERPGAITRRMPRISRKVPKIK